MDAVERFVCQEGSEKFKDAVKLNDIDSISDPETDPFKSKYQAREKWMSIKTELEESLNLCESSDQDFVKFLLAALYFRIGSNFSETEEVSSGQEYLCKCVDIIKPLRLHEKACNTLQIAYNQLGILWTTRRQPEKALAYLRDAEALYSEYKKEVGNGPYQSEELFDIKQGGNECDSATVQKRSENFEHCYTLTQYYLAQVYAKLEENEKSAKYCHTTLRRQLESKKYDPLDWALNAATLSQFYMTVGKMDLSRHCLASAQRILSETGEPNLQVSVNEDDSQTEVERKEKIPRIWADLYRCWIKYGLSLMENSMTRLIEKVNRGEELDQVEENSDETKEDDGASNGDHNADKKQGNSESNPENSTLNEDNTGANLEKETNEKGNKKSLFFDLELTSIEEVITDKYLRVFEEARPVFLQIQKWIGEAKEFYALDGHCTDHVELIQDHSKAFKLLAFFELDFERQCKMHKRRVDMLEVVLKELSQQFYLMICRQLMYEIAEIYSAMLDLKLAIIEDAGTTPSPHAVKKINQLTAKSIGEFERYIDTLKTGSDKTLPSQFCSDDERPALIAYFCMGRLHSKYLEFEIEKKLDNMKKSLECYKFLVDYCNTNPTAKNVAGSEYEICAEMVALMPFKMEKLRNQMA